MSGLHWVLHDMTFSLVNCNVMKAHPLSVNWISSDESMLLTILWSATSQRHAERIDLEQWSWQVDLSVQQLH